MLHKCQDNSDVQLHVHVKGHVIFECFAKTRFNPGIPMTG